MHVQLNLKEHELKIQLSLEYDYIEDYESKKGEQKKSQEDKDAERRERLYKVQQELIEK